MLPFSLFPERNLLSPVLNEKVSSKEPEKVPEGPNTYQSNYYHTTSSKVPCYYDFYINTSINRDQPWFYPLLKCLNDPEIPVGDSTVRIFLNSPGGSTFDALQIVSAMGRSNKPIKLYIEGICCSASTIILFSLIDLSRNWDVEIISNDTMFLFHNGFTWEFGKPNDVKDSIDWYSGFMRDLFNRVYKYVLKQDEIDDVLSGKELFMSGQEVNDRLRVYTVDKSLSSFKSIKGVTKKKTSRKKS